MSRLKKKLIERTGKTGSPPGLLKYSGEKRVDSVQITRFEYNISSCEEKRLDHLDISDLQKANDTVLWINIDGLHQTEILAMVGERFHIHPLVLEDILYTDQRPKVENHGEYLYLVVKMLDMVKNDTFVQSEQVSFLLLNGIVFTFQEKPGDVFDPVRERIRSGKGIIRSQTADYLLYTLLDVLVDRYFSILEKMDERVETVDRPFSEQLTEETLKDIHEIKRELIFLRRITWPLREVLSECRNRDTALISQTTRTYFKDIYDHCIHIIDTLEILKDLLSENTELLLTRISNRTNETMKVLTIISTIFMPLSFIAGIYGMNFFSMPELSWEFGYPLILGIMGVVALIMLALFKKKRWF
jgi:magnesium transporter